MIEMNVFAKHCSRNVCLHNDNKIYYFVIYTSEQNDTIPGNDSSNIAGSVLPGILHHLGLIARARDVNLRVSGRRECPGIRSSLNELSSYQGDDRFPFASISEVTTRRCFPRYSARFRTFRKSVFCTKFTWIADGGITSSSVFMTEQMNKSGQRVTPNL